MPKCLHRSCKFCLWNWVEPIDLPPATCYNRESPKYHKKAVGGCSKFEAPAAESEYYELYQYPNGRPPKKKKAKEIDSHAAS